MKGAITAAATRLARIKADRGVVPTFLRPSVAALAVVVALPTLAAAKEHKKHHCSLNLTALETRVRVDRGNPPVSGSDTEVATLDGIVCGKPFHGAARVANTFPTLGKVRSRVVNFGTSGSLRANSTGNGKPNPDGSLSVSGHGPITGGTGLYTGATGSISFTGTQPKNSNVATLHLTGSFKY